MRKERQNLALSATSLSELVAEVRSETLAYLRTEAKSAIASLREQLSDDEQTLLTLRIDRGLEWNEITQVFAGEAALEAAQLKREAARLRKRFELTKEKLRRLATEAGLLER